MKKIMIFYGSYGGGHLSAAKAIKEYIEKNYEDTDIQMIDCVEYVNKYLDKITTKAYSDMAKVVPKAWGYIYKKSESGIVGKFSIDINKLMAIKLNKLLRNFKPDYVMSTHPFSSFMCAYLKKKGKANFKLSTILTDFAPHDQWLMFPKFVDLFFVAHDGMKKALISKEIDENKIHVSGIPLSNRFLEDYNNEETLQEFGLEDNKPTILFFGGGKMGLGKSRTLEILKVLASDFKDFQIIAISGKNKDMYNNFKEIVAGTKREDSIKLLEFTDKIPQLMKISNVVITKPGGLTTTESLASNLPMIIINPIPGQEEENAEFLENNGVGIWIRKNDSIKEKLESILSDYNKLKEMKEKTKILANPHSTENICKIILD